MSATIWCFLVGGPNIFPVDIDATKTVGHLKIKIKEGNPVDLKNLDPVYLTLYRLEVDDSDDEPNHVNHLNQLAQNLNVGNALHSWKPLSEVWIEAPQGKRYCIVVQAPKDSDRVQVPKPQRAPPDDTVAEQRQASNIALVVDVAPSTTRNRRRSQSPPSPQSLVDHAEQRHRAADGSATRRIRHSVPGSANDDVDAPNLELSKMYSIHSAIKPLSRKVLSDPKIFILLPFPSPLRVLTKRFTLSTEGTLPRFRYMGRSNFESLLKEVEKPAFLTGSSTLYLYGPSGTGKSHLLAALVYYLVGKGERVVFIPDCRTLLNDLEDEIRKALLFAFHNDPDRCGEISRARDMEDLVKFVRKQPEHSMYIVVDQRNSLDLDGPNDLNDDAKKAAMAAINKLRASQMYILSASASQQSDRNSEQKQSGIKVFHFRAGLNEEETRVWFEHNKPSLPTLSTTDRGFIEDITGRIPLLIQPLLTMQSFDETTFLQSEELTDMYENITSFYNKILWSTDRPEPVLDAMRAVILAEPTMANKDLFDVRYFFRDNHYIWHPTCGLALKALIDVHRQHDNTVRDIGAWYAAVSSAPNVTVLGFLVERICIEAIQKGGLRTVDGRLNVYWCFTRRTFTVIPPFMDLIRSEDTPGLYVPLHVDFAHIDAAVVWLDCRARKAHVYLIQVTAHKDFETSFYQRQWPNWKEGFPDDYDVSSTFVRVGMKERSTEDKPDVPSHLSSGEKVVEDAHKCMHINIEEVDAKLYSHVVRWRKRMVALG